jgi:ATP-dependent helicase/nuclease subunit A
VPTGYEDEHDPQAELARQIARKIKRWLDSNEALPGASRTIAPGDIMILLRRRGRFADLMVRALNGCNVPVTCVDRMRLVSQLPVMDLLAPMRFVLLPEDDLNLAALLRGPLMGFSEEQLMLLAIGRTGTLWQSLRDMAYTSSLFSTAHDYLAARLGEADFSTPFAFLSHLLNAPCPAHPTSGRMALWGRLGDEALDPIDELLNEAQAFAQRHSPSLQNFLHWLTKADAEIKRELDHGGGLNGGQVRIMTVHASKGLEAPIVFLPDTASMPRTADIPKFQWTADGLPLFLARKPGFMSSPAGQLWQKARERQLQEYRRLFYVALTRAASRLYICGWQNNVEGDNSGSWYNLAATALRPLHRAYLADRQQPDPIPDVIYGDADPLLATSPKLSPPALTKIALPAWAHEHVSEHFNVLSVAPPSTADALAAALPDAAFTRGRIIHRLLQSLPEIVEEKRSAAIMRFLSHPRHQLDAAQRDEIAQEVSNLLNDERFASLFGIDSRAEVPLTGNIAGMPIFRQVDRLCLRGDEVWIVDYKTNRPPPVNESEIPDAYRRQLMEYRALLAAIYPHRRVRCFLLWTYAPHLMEIAFC